MKMKFVASLWLAVLLAGLTGCATNKINWTSRVGSYTFDQAVVDMGPPDKQAKLSDGKTVAEWVTRYSNGGMVMVGGGFYSRPGSVGFIEATPNYYERKLRLTFTPDNILAAWSKN
jgi:hypothetical protein